MGDPVSAERIYVVYELTDLRNGEGAEVGAMIELGRITARNAEGAMRTAFKEVYGEHADREAVLLAIPIRYCTPTRVGLATRRTVTVGIE